MAVVKVTRNNQVTIPKKIARKLGISEGDFVEIFVRGDELVIRKVKSIDELIGSWRHLDTDVLLKHIIGRWRKWSSV